MAMQKYVVVLALNNRAAQRYIRQAGLSRGRTRFAHSASAIRHLRMADLHILPGFEKRSDKHAILSALRFVRGERIQAFLRPELIEDLLEEAYQENTMSPYGSNLQMTAYGDITPEDIEDAYDMQALLLSASEIGALQEAAEHPDALRLDLAEWAGNTESLEGPKVVLSEDELNRAPDFSPEHAQRILDREPPSEIRLDVTGNSDPTVPGIDEGDTDPVAPIVKKRRTKCKDCEQLHFKDEACPSPAAGWF